MSRRQQVQSTLRAFLGSPSHVFRTGLIVTAPRTSARGRTAHHAQDNECGRSVGVRAASGRWSARPSTGRSASAGKWKFWEWPDPHRGLPRTAGWLIRVRRLTGLVGWPGAVPRRRPGRRVGRNDSCGCSRFAGIALTSGRAPTGAPRRESPRRRSPVPRSARRQAARRVSPLGRGRLCLPETLAAPLESERRALNPRPRLSGFA